MRLRYRLRYPKPVEQKPDLIPDCPIWLRPENDRAGFPRIVASSDWNLGWNTATIDVEIPDGATDDVIVPAAIAAARQYLLERFAGARPRHVVAPEPTLTKATVAARTEAVSDEDEPATAASTILIPLPPEAKKARRQLDEQQLTLHATERELPKLRALILSVIKRPFQLVLHGDVATSSTDCRAVVEFNPEPLEQGELELAYGRALHEAAHLRASRGSTIMARAHQLGGELLAHIVNLGMDAKDDAALAAEFPGYAPLLRRRGKNLAGESISPEGYRLRPHNPLHDFYLSCKLRRRPRTAVGRQATALMRRAIRRVQDGESDEAIISAGLQIADLLRPHLRTEDEVVATLRARTLHRSGCENGNCRFSTATRARFQKIIAKLARGDRERGYRKLPHLARTLQQSGGGLPWGGEAPAVEKVGPAHPATYTAVRQDIEPQIERLVRSLRRLGRMEETFVLHGLDEGELDLRRTARIAIGAPGIYCEKVPEHETDAEIHLVLDHSGSMLFGDSLRSAVRLGVLFNEAIYRSRPELSGRLWGFSEAVVDYGECRPNIGLVGAEADGNTDEAGALYAVGKQILRSRRARRAVIVVGDGGSNDPPAVARIVSGLSRAGVLCIRILVNVLGAPSVYPIELPFSNFGEILPEFDRILTSLLRH